MERIPVKESMIEKEIPHKDAFLDRLGLHMHNLFFGNDICIMV